MIKQRYLNQIKQLIQTEIPPKVRVFIFGSAARDDRFHDLDIGIEGLSDKISLGQLRDRLEDSTLPYSVDLIDFDRVDEDFKQSVMKDKVLWLT